MTRRASLVRALPLSLQRWACSLLGGHVLHVDQDSPRLQLACEICPHRSPGFDTHVGVASRQLPGDARRFESHARKIARPAPVPADWYADEHFQGDHAR